MSITTFPPAAAVPLPAALGVRVYPTDALALHAGDAAGGDLAGAYPNPSVAPKVPPLLAAPEGLRYFPDALSARLDAAFGATVGTVIQRDTGGWVGTAPPGTAGKVFVSGASGSPGSWKTPGVSGTPTFSGTFVCEDGTISGTVSGLTIAFT